MKKIFAKIIFLIILILFCISIGCINNDEKNNSDGGSGDTGHSSFFAVAVGELGSIIHINNDKCVKVESPIGYGIYDELDDVVVLSKNCAFIAGCASDTDSLFDGEEDSTMIVRKESSQITGMVDRYGVILRWDGVKWKMENIPTKKILMSIDAISKDFVYAVGQDGVILHYNGKEWKEVESPVKDMFTADDIFYLKDIKLYSKDFGIAVGGSMMSGFKGVILVFNGIEWKIERINQDQMFDAVGIADKNYVAAGGFSDIYSNEPLHLIERINNEWKKVDGLPCRKFVTGISFANKKIGFAVTDNGNPLIIKYSSNEWKPIDHNIDQALTGITMLDENTGFAVGTPEFVYTDNSGVSYYTIIKWDGKNWSKIDTKNVSKEGINLYGVSGVF